MNIYFTVQILFFSSTYAATKCFLKGDYNFSHEEITINEQLKTCINEDNCGIISGYVPSLFNGTFQGCKSDIFDLLITMMTHDPKFNHVLNKNSLNSVQTKCNLNQNDIITGILYDETFEIKLNCFKSEHISEIEDSYELDSVVDEKNVQTCPFEVTGFLTNSPKTMIYPNNSNISCVLGKCVFFQMYIDEKTKTTFRGCEPQFFDSLFYISKNINSELDGTLSLASQLCTMTGLVKKEGKTINLSHFIWEGECYDPSTTLPPTTNPNLNGECFFHVTGFLIDSPKTIVHTNNSYVTCANDQCVFFEMYFNDSLKAVFTGCDQEFEYSLQYITETISPELKPTLKLAYQSCNAVASLSKEGTTPNVDYFFWYVSCAYADSNGPTPTFPPTKKPHTYKTCPSEGTGFFKNDKPANEKTVNCPEGYCSYLSGTINKINATFQGCPSLMNQFLQVTNHATYNDSSPQIAEMNNKCNVQSCSFQKFEHFIFSASLYMDCYSGNSPDLKGCVPNSQKIASTKNVFFIFVLLLPMLF